MLSASCLSGPNHPYLQPVASSSIYSAPLYAAALSLLQPLRTGPIWSGADHLPQIFARAKFSDFIGAQRNQKVDFLTPLGHFHFAWSYLQAFSKAALESSAQEGCPARSLVLR